MRALVSFVLAFITVQAVAAGTFTGTTTATFRVRETLDGTTTTATKTGPLNVTLNTDYTTMRWALNWNVNLVMAGGPTQSFETDLVASGSVTSRRCPNTGFGCAISGAGDPSPLSFPNATGTSGAGDYMLLGSAEWKVTDRIVTSSRERISPLKAISGSAYVASDTKAYSSGSHYLTVADYPTSISLAPGLSSYSAWQGTNGVWNTYFGAPLNLGRIVDGSNYLEVAILTFPTTFSLIENPAGDLNDNGTVDASDYVLWRKSPGPLTPFLSSYSVWRGNYGASASSLSGSLVPEPSALLPLLMAALFPIRRR